MVEKTTIRKSVSTCGKPPKVTRPTEFKQKRDLTNNEIKIIQFAKKINNSGSDQRISGAILAGLFWVGVIPVAVMTTPQTMVLTIMDLEMGALEMALVITASPFKHIGTVAKRLDQGIRANITVAY